MPETVYCEATDLGKKNGLKSGPQPKELVGRSIMKGFYEIADPKRLAVLQGVKSSDPRWIEYIQWQKDQNAKYVEEYEKACQKLGLVKVYYREGGSDWIAKEDAARKVDKKVASYEAAQETKPEESDTGRRKRRLLDDVPEAA